MSEVLILCYHAVSDDWPSELAVPPGRLEAQLRRLLRRGYRPMTLSEALELGGGRALVVTFDDAYRSVFTRALPVLERLEAPATVFVPTAYVAEARPMRWSSLAEWGDTPFAGELACMAWEELRALAERGWEIGSHTSSHPDLTSLSDEELERELVTSRKTCEEQVRRPCRALAYPFGAHDRRTMSAARGAGYDCAVILDDEVAIRPGRLPRSGGGEQFALLREGVYRRDGRLRFAAKASALARRARASRLVNRLFAGA